jgi:hypothetical protein
MPELTQWLALFAWLRSDIRKGLLEGLREAITGKWVA